MDLEFVLERFAGKRVLLLQGPVGPFFARLGRALCEHGAEVFKVNFNGGDWLFYPAGAMRYSGRLEHWPTDLGVLVERLRIHVIVLFGDCRPIHAPAHDLGVEVWAFEEGYVRPNFVTFEPHGVNYRSRLPRDPDFYRSAPVPPLRPPREVGNTFWWMAAWASLYYAAAFAMRPIFRRDLHHRPLAVREGLPWLVSPYRKWKYKLLERGLERKLSSFYSKRYFLVPLQVHVDAQVRVHSRFASVPNFIESVVSSFAREADSSNVLAIKHHPLDRGYHDYSELVADLGAKYGLKERLFYIHDQHLPTLLANARGVVLINSTVGLSALHHGTPLKVLGDAMYDLPGLTAQCELDRFWSEPERWAPDMALYASFVGQLISRTQLNGSFYRTELLFEDLAGREKRSRQPLTPCRTRACDWMPTARSNGSLRTPASPETPPSQAASGSAPMATRECSLLTRGHRAT